MMSLLTKKGKNREALSLDFLVDLYEKQNGCCAISGVKMTYLAGHGRQDTNISIDQIRPGAGYTENNVQLVCRCVNSMKYDYSMDNFISWCRKIVEFNEKKETTYNMVLTYAHTLEARIAKLEHNL